MQPKLIAIKLIELTKRLIHYDKRLGVYHNGIDNNYPERVERIINNSATAKPAAKLFRKYVVGIGFGDVLNNFIVNKISGSTLRKLLQNIGQSYSYHNGIYIHANYNLAYEITSLDVLPFVHCRAGEKDDKEYNGKIIIYDNWDGAKGKIDKKKYLVIDVYNSNENVIEAQIQKAGNINKYKGQVFFFNPESTIYPLAHIDNVMDDADSEKMSSVFKNTSLRKGFFGKKVVITPPMLGSNLRKHDSLLTDDDRLQKAYEESERGNFKTSMQSFMGADNEQGILHLEMEFEGDDIEKTIKFIDVETNINDALFKHTETSCASNIRKAYSNIPSILIENNDSSIFGNSGEMLKQAKLFYQDQTQEDRDMIEIDVLKPLLSKFKDFNYPVEGLKIMPLIDTETSNKTEDAQAELKGSVGGVTALTTLVQSVSSGILDLEAAVNIVIEIYGFEESIARKMIGTPKIKPNESIS